MNEEERPGMGAAVQKALGLLLGLVLTMWPTLTAARASAPTVIPVGKAVGIKLFSDGVVVVGTSDIATEGPRTAAYGRGTSSPTSTPPRWTPLRRCPPCSRSWRTSP